MPPKKNKATTVLLTAFEPYLDVKVNSSWEALKDWDKRVLDEAELRVIKMPVVYGQVKNRLVKALERYRPSIVIAFGQYPYRRSEILLENIAVNVNYSEAPDNRGKMPRGNPVVKEGPLALATKLPLIKVLNRLKKKHIRVKLSYSAGTYLCNHQFYHIMYLAAKYRFIKQAGFVHLPALSDIMPLRKMQSACEQVVRETILELKRSK